LRIENGECGVDYIHPKHSKNSVVGSKLFDLGGRCKWIADMDIVS
jgi:hypothetical protein